MMTSQSLRRQGYPYIPQNYALEISSKFWNFQNSNFKGSALQELKIRFIGGSNDTMKVIII